MGETPPNDSTTVGSTRSLVLPRAPRVEEVRATARAIRIHREQQRGGQREVLSSTLALHPDRHYTFGRGHSADVIFDEDRVSRQHGALRHDGERWIFVDLGSANGSFICRAADVHATGASGTDIPARRLVTGEHVALEPGDALLLGTRRAWLEILAELPEGALHARARAETMVSAAAQAFEQKLDVAARTRLPVFLLGPSGAGKTMSAREIHRRAGLPGHFVAINCARLPTDPTQLHSELLGHVAGAFTGAAGARVGRFFAAHDGTLFLDEVESLPPVAQGFLLDLLDRGSDLQPLGAPAGKARAPVQVRLVSASKVPLARSGLRADLSERLAEGHLWSVPPLDERREDIPGLIAAFLEELREEGGVDAVLTDEAVRLAVAQPWPGQIRELRAAVRALVHALHAVRVKDGITHGRVVVREADFRERIAERAAAFEGLPPTSSRDFDDLPAHATMMRPRPVHPRALTATDVQDALLAAGGNRTRAAELLGIARNTLLAKIRQLKIDEKK